MVLLLSVREKVLNSFKNRLFPIKNLDKIATREATLEPATEPEVAKEPATEPEVATEPRKTTKAKLKLKISSLKLCQKFLYKIKNAEKNINEQIFNEFLIICIHHL